MPEVSVIIPAYNTAAYIARAIGSALGQTLKDIEVIVVDDASTEATTEIAKSFCDQRLKVLVNQQNLGVSAARNRGLREAKGKWIAVLDSDDWYASKRLEKLLQIANAEGADVIIDDLYLVQNGEKSPWSTLLYESGEQIYQVINIDPVYFIETGIYGQRGLHLGIAKPIFKRDFIVRHGITYDETMQVVEDFCFSMKCLVNGANFVFVPKPYYFYCARPGSLVTQSKVRHINQFSYAISYLLQHESVQINSRLVHSLSKNLVVLKKNKAYYSVVEPLKQKKFLKALVEAMYNPYFFLHFITQICNILNRRIQYYLYNEKTVYETMYQSTKNL
jgi:succinoglycan biosynthesis protein ExoO